MQCYFVEIGREWVREMAELTIKYQTKLEEVQARNKELRLELAEVQVDIKFLLFCNLHALYRANYAGRVEIKRNGGRRIF